MVDVLEQSGANRPKPGLITTPTSTITVETADVAAIRKRLGLSLRTPS